MHNRTQLVFRLRFYPFFPDFRAKSELWYGIQIIQKRNGVRTIIPAAPYSTTPHPRPPNESNRLCMTLRGIAILGAHFTYKLIQNHTRSYKEPSSRHFSRHFFVWFCIIDSFGGRGFGARNDFVLQEWSCGHRLRNLYASFVWFCIMLRNLYAHFWGTWHLPRSYQNLVKWRFFEQHPSQERFETQKCT